MQIAMAGKPRYPTICVQVESRNPLALVAAVREALRLAHVKRSEISRFSNQAFASESPTEVKKVCREWVRVDPENSA